eukprot:GSMAST32.ASY1.ANO1.745.1 assembled CDS
MDLALGVGIGCIIGWSTARNQRPSSIIKKSRPKVGVGVFVTNPKHPGCILLGIRRGSDGSGTYALPGGHVEFGESWETTAARETLEETGQKITSMRCVTVDNSVKTTENYHYITAFMVGSTFDEPINMEPDKCDGWEWILWNSEYVFFF